MFKFIKYFILILCLIFLSGCFIEPELIPEPIIIIRIEPKYTEIYLGESIELACFDQLNRSVMANWSKRCGAGNLSVETGETCIYTTPRTMEGIQIIWADYGSLRAEARVNGIRK